LKSEDIISLNILSRETGRSRRSNCRKRLCI